MNPRRRRKMRLWRRHARRDYLCREEGAKLLRDDWLLGSFFAAHFLEPWPKIGSARWRAVLEGNRPPETGEAVAKRFAEILAKLKAEHPVIG